MPKARVLRRWATNFAFTLPFLIFYGVFILFPVVQAILMSFFDWDLLGSTREWIGLENYTHMLGGTGLVWDISSMWMRSRPFSLLCIPKQVAPSYGLSNRYHWWSEQVLVSIVLWYHDF